MLQRFSASAAAAAVLPELDGIFTLEEEQKAPLRAFLHFSPVLDTVWFGWTLRAVTHTNRKWSAAQAAYTSQNRQPFFVRNWTEADTVCSCCCHGYNLFIAVTCGVQYILVMTRKKDIYRLHSRLFSQQTGK